MKTPERYLRFCGIDMAKQKHMACIIDRDGQRLLRPKSFRNDAAGFQQILKCLKETGNSKTILIGMEATGHYWYSLHDFLIRQGYTVVVLNPIQPAQQAKQAIRKCKTDKYDAFHIASLLRSGQYRPALVPGELGMTCRQLTRLRYRLIGQSTRIKQLIRSRLHPAWPEYEKLFVNPFCATSKKLLLNAPTPQQLLALKPEDIGELIRKTSRGKYGSTQAQKIWQQAENSVGMKRGLYGIATSIRILLEQVEALKTVRQKLEDEIDNLADQLPKYLFTIPGATTLSVVSLYGEIDPIEAFTAPSQLVAFAGLDPKVFQTGQYNAPRRQISKRGSPFLRRTLWQMAHRAIYQEGDLRNFWLRKRSQQKHHFTAVTAAANKLCHIIWRIMTDRRDYIP